MNKLVLIALVFAGFSSFAQDFPGYRSGNYTGVNSVFFNPANIAGSRYYFDVNLVSASTMAANDQAAFRLSDISESFNGDSIRNQLFGMEAGAASGMFTVDIHGPSGMMGLGEKNAIALTSRGRMFANALNVDGKLFQQISNSVAQDPALPYTLSSQENMRFAVNAWTEFGASFARVLVDQQAHFFKGGLTLKYLAGSANGYVNIDNFSGTVVRDALLNMTHLTNASGQISTGFAGMNIAGFEAKNLFKMKSSGFGADLGFVYEYRPDPEMQTVDGIKLDNNYKNTYRFKFGLALTDLGSIHYKKDPRRSGSYDIDISSAEFMPLRQLNNLDVDDYNQFFADRPQFFTPTPGNGTDYSVSLPTALQVEADLLLYDGWYLNLASQVSLSNNPDKPYNNRSYTSFTLTPRYEGKIFGGYLPLNYNPLTKLNAGLAFRAGPLFFGSGSLLTAVMGESQQADFFIGFRLGELK